MDQTLGSTRKQWFSFRNCGNQRRWFLVSTTTSLSSQAPPTAIGGFFVSMLQVTHYGQNDSQTWQWQNDVYQWKRWSINSLLRMVEYERLCCWNYAQTHPPVIHYGYPHIPSTGNSYAQFCAGPKRKLSGGRFSSKWNILWTGLWTDTTRQDNSFHCTPTTYLEQLKLLTQSTIYLKVVSLSAKTRYTLNGYDIWLLRVTEQWDTVWTRTFNDPIYLYDTEANYFDAVADSGCIFEVASSTDFLLKPSSTVWIHQKFRMDQIFFWGNSPGRRQKQIPFYRLLMEDLFFQDRQNLVTISKQKCIWFALMEMECFRNHTNTSIFPTTMILSFIPILHMKVLTGRFRRKKPETTCVYYIGILVKRTYTIFWFRQVVSARIFFWHMFWN